MFSGFSQEPNNKSFYFKKCMEVKAYVHILENVCAVNPL